MEIVYSKEKLENCGIYQIRNKINNKIYVGSSINMYKRFKNHKITLLLNKHKNIYLQRAVNKYGIKNFIFEVIEFCDKEKILIREDYYLQLLNCCNKSVGYNINPSATGGTQFTEEVIKRRTITLKETYKKKLLNPEFKGYNTKSNKTSFQKGIQVWNKGRKYNSTNHLKVPKKKKGNRENFKQTLKEKQIPISIYDINMNFIKTFNYVEDIILNSEELLKFMILRNKNGRNGYSAYHLTSMNIHKSCNHNISYKGLNFRYNAHDKLDKLLENQEIDNQQPSINLKD